jgi:hypothetical protein
MTTSKILKSLIILSYTYKRWLATTNWDKTRTSLKTNNKKNHTLGEKLAVFIKFKNEILRPYGLRMTGKG